MKNLLSLALFAAMIGGLALTADTLAQPPTTQATQLDGLDLLNQQRSTSGRGPLLRDAALMRGALSKATEAARRGFRGHLGGRLPGGATKEGIGFGTGRKFRACYSQTAPAGTPSGAAIVRGRDGWYYSCLLIRYRGSLSPQPGQRTGRRWRLFR